jgi:hypothetical protein
MTEAVPRKRRRRRRAKKHVDHLNRVRPFYDRLLEHQEGVCGVCGKPPSSRRRFDIDHDHHAMYTRGLLHARCNRALPSWVTPLWLRQAADYLERGRIPWLEEALSSLDEQ